MYLCPSSSGSGIVSERRYLGRRLVFPPHAVTVVATFALAFAVLPAFMGLLHATDGRPFLPGGMALAAAFGLFVAAAHEGLGRRRLVRLAVPACVLTAITAGLHQWMSDCWASEYLLGWTVLLVLRKPWAWLAYLAVLGADLTAFHDSSGTRTTVGARVSCYLLSGLLIVSVDRMTTLARQVRQARKQIESQAVAEERARVSRALHDRLGYSFVAIKLRSELAERLVESEPARARSELAAVSKMAADAHTEIRAVAHGMIGAGFDRELAGAADLLQAAGIRCRLRIAHEPGGPMGAALSQVLREAVANVVRHANAENCTIEAVLDGDVFHLSVENDGVDSDRPCDATGSGLSGTADRLTRLGGRLTVSHPLGGRFRIEAELPWPQPGPGTDGPRSEDNK